MSELGNTQLALDPEVFERGSPRRRSDEMRRFRDGLERELDRIKVELGRMDEAHRRSWLGL